MKKYVLSLAIVSALLFVTTNIQAQSWADLFKKENIEKVVNAVTGNNAIDMTGTWTYSGSAIEFERTISCKKPVVRLPLLLPRTN